MDFRAVFFDVGNTLLHPYPSVSEVCREVLLAAGHVRDLEAIDRLMPIVDEYYEDRYREDDTFWTDECETSSVWVGMYSLLCRELGIEEDAEMLAHRVYEEFGDPKRWRVYEDVPRAFERLRNTWGLGLGIISNWDARLESLLDGLGLMEMLDVVVSSAAVGLHKPDPRIFEYACRELDVDPKQAVHVGDHHYADMLGARSVGMTAVLIDRRGAESRMPAVRTLDDVESFLGWR